MPTLGITPPPMPPPKKKKHYPTSFLPSPLKSTNYPSSSFLGNSPSILVFHAPPFSESPKYESISSLIQSYLMIEKNIFAYKIFLLLNISDFIFYVTIASHPPWKKSPPQKLEVLSNPPFRKFDWRLKPHPLSPCRKGEVYTMGILMRMLTNS